VTQFPEGGRKRADNSHLLLPWWEEVGRRGDFHLSRVARRAMKSYGIIYEGESEAAFRFALGTAGLLLAAL